LIALIVLITLIIRKQPALGNGHQMAGQNCQKEQLFEHLFYCYITELNNESWKEVDESRGRLRMK